MSKGLIWQGILIFGGFIIIGLSTSWLLVLGLVLVLWGNNLQTSMQYKEYFSKLLGNTEDE